MSGVHLYLGGGYGESHLKRTVGLTPEVGMSPNEFMFPQRIPIIGDDGVKRKNDGSVDSMGVLE